MENPLGGPRPFVNALPDVAAEADWFSDDTHPGPFSRIADDIANVILQGQTGVVVGLEGPWGSGKTTVVNLVKRAIGCPHHMLVFDVWAHKGDVLRRAFLDQLITELQRAKLLSGKRVDYWDGRRQELAGHKRTRRETVTTRLRTLGYILLGLTGLVPLGLAIFNRALQDGMSIDIFSGAPIHAMGVFGLIVATAPLLVALCVLVVRNIEKALRGTWNPDEWLEPLASVFSASRDADATKTLFETSTPTSVEFESAFREVLDEVALVSPSTKLVICFDNVDRVESDEVRIILATLATFIDPNWRGSGQIWTIIPFSRKALERLVSANSGGDGLFLDKYVQVSYVMPVLPLIRWRSFMAHCIERTSVGFEAYDVSRVIDLFELCSSGAPSPRQIIRFSNLLAVFFVRAAKLDEHFPLEIVVFLAFRSLSQSGEDILVDLNKGLRILHPIALLPVEGVFEVWLASLLFYVPYAEAQEWWLISALLACCTTGDAMQLTQMSIHAEFQSALDKVDFDSVVQEGHPELLLIAVNTIVESGVENALGGRKGRRSSLLRLEDIIARVPAWYTNSLPEFGQVACRALINLGKPQTSLHFLQRIAIEPGEGLPIGQNWISSMVCLLDGLAKDENQYQHLADRFEINLQGEQYLYACSQYARLSRDGRGQSLFKSSNQTLAGENVAGYLSGGRRVEEGERFAIDVATSAADSAFAIQVLPNIRDTLMGVGRPWSSIEACFLALGNFADSGILPGSEYPHPVVIQDILMTLSSVDDLMYQVNVFFWILYYMGLMSSSAPRSLLANAGQNAGWNRLVMSAKVPNPHEAVVSLVEVCQRRKVYEPLQVLAIMGDLDDTLLEVLDSPPPALDEVPQVIRQP